MEQGPGTKTVFEARAFRPGAITLAEGAPTPGFSDGEESRARGWARRFRALVFDISLLPASLRLAIARAVDHERAYGHGFLFVPVSLGLGSLAWFSATNPPQSLKLAVLLCIFGIAAWWMRHSATAWRLVFLHVFLFVAGMMLAQGQTARLGTVLIDTPVTTMLSGTVEGREVTDKGYWRYTVTVTATTDPELKRPPERVTLLSRQRDLPIAIGEGLTGRARLSPPSGPALAGLNDFAFDSYFNGIGAVGYFLGKPAATGRGLEPAPWFQSASENLARLRAAIGERIRSALNGDVAAIAAALVTGEERAIGRETVEALRQAGLAHVLAISGLNMVLAAGTLLVGVRLALSVVPGLAHRVAIKKIAAAGAVLMVCFYVLICGGAVSAVRSWIMILLMLVAVFFDRQAISLRNVALSAILILAVTPSAVTGPGFQMSYAATLALVAGYGHWRGRPQSQAVAAPAGLMILRATGLFVGGLLLSSLIGGLSTMIYSVGHFHRIAAYGLVGNMLAMPIISVLVMPFALIAMLAMPFGLEYLPLQVVGLGLEWMIAIADMVSHWGGEITTGRIAPAGFLLVALGGILFCLLRSWLATVGAVMALAGVTVIVLLPPAGPEAVISEDGRLVALIDGGTAAVNRLRPPEFIFSQWERALQLSQVTPPLMRRDLALPLPDRKADAAKTGSLDEERARAALSTLMRRAAPAGFPAWRGNGAA
ncbi:MULTISPECIES: ComEC/Rec2 family competence protein [unclassified Rhizobium]|uniref:ComEC/Rec2 family competence protein n=1 Tax=unclassified Rhizobium TaxID=2613769 RepID=UPI0009E6804F|nr:MULTISPECIES: ComEC/Rec2 family competence protein [unclassified Rhizobium]